MSVSRLTECIVSSWLLCFVVSALMFRVLSIAIETETVSPERERESCTGTR